MSDYRRYDDYKSDKERLNQKNRWLQLFYSLGIFLFILNFVFNYTVFLNEKITRPLSLVINGFFNQKIIFSINSFLEKIHWWFYPLKNFPNEINSVSLLLAIFFLFAYLQLVLDMIYENKRFLSPTKSFVVTIIYSWSLFIFLQWVFEHPLNAEVFAALFTAIVLELLAFNKYWVRKFSLRPVWRWFKIQWQINICEFGTGIYRLLKRRGVRRRYSSTAQPQSTNI